MEQHATNNEATCQLKQHLVRASQEMDPVAQFAATFLATLDYFVNPLGELHTPNPDDLEMLSRMYKPGYIDSVAIRSKCSHCALHTPCTVARALEACESLCGKA